MLTRNASVAQHWAHSRGRRSLTLAAALLVGLTVVGLTVAPPALASGPSDSDTPPAVPVAGVDAFGIGALQGRPDGVAVDARGDVFEAAGNQVVEYARGPTGTSYARRGVTVGGGGGLGPGLSQLSSPAGVALDGHGNLFVGDSGNNRVVEYLYRAAQHRYATVGRVVAGTGAAGRGLTQLSDPQGLAIDRAGNLFVADWGNNRVERFAYHAAAGRYAAAATTVAGRGGAGSGLSQLEGASSVALDAGGDLFVADSLNLRVLEYAVNVRTGSYPVRGKPVASRLPDPVGWVALDHSGDLFASYSYLGSGGVLEFRYQPATRSFAAPGTAVGDGDMVGPTGLAFDASGHLFVGETSRTVNPNQTVWWLVLEFSYNPRSGTFSPAGTILYQLGRVNEGVSAVALDGRGNLFVSDGPVYEFGYRPATRSYSVRGAVLARSGGALALDSGNDLFVASPGGPDARGVLEYRWQPAAGRYARTGIPVPGATQLSGLDVAALAFDSRRNLFVASGDQVLEFRYRAGAGTWAASGTVLATVTAGQPGIRIGPVGLALDGRGDLMVSDPVAGLVRDYLFDAKTGAYASAGIVVAGGGGQLHDPAGVALDRGGHLFVFDAGSGRVIEFTGNPATGVYRPSDVVIFTGGQDNNPENGGVAVDRTGDAFFGNNYYSAVVYEVAPG